MLNVAFNPHFRRKKCNISVGLNCQIDSHSGKGAKWKWGWNISPRMNTPGRGFAPTYSQLQTGVVVLAPPGRSQGHVAKRRLAFWKLLPWSWPFSPLTYCRFLSEKTWAKWARSRALGFMPPVFLSFHYTESKSTVLCNLKENTYAVLWYMFFPKWQCESNSPRGISLHAFFWGC